jgi:trigger factor
MQVSIETTSGLERRLTVGVPAARVDSEVDVRLQKAAKNAKLDGFRPGKVPMRVIRDRFGPGVRQEVLGEVVNQSFQEAVMQEKLRPAGQPNIEPKNTAAGKDLEYIATFEVFPEITVADMGDLAIERPVAEVKADDVDNMIEIFRKQQGGWGDAERVAAEGDKVNLDYAGTKDGEAFDGGSAEGSDLELGSGRMIPGFEDGIVGMKAGEEKTLELSFPDEYHNEDLKGAAVEFKVTVNTVSEQLLADLDETLFASYGVEDGGEEQFRKEIEANMARELKNAVRGKVKQQVMDGVLASHEALEVPKALIGQEISVLRSQMFQQFGGAAGADLDLDSLLPDEMFNDQADRRVKLGLILAELVQQYELRPDAEQVRTAVEELAATYQDPEEVINHYYSNPQQLASVESMVLEDQLVEKLLENAHITDTECSYQEALSQAQEQAPA